MVGGGEECIIDNKKIKIVLIFFLLCLINYANLKRGASHERND